jgi:hypothetical protein
VEGSRGDDEPGGHAEADEVDLDHAAGLETG